MLKESFSHLYSYASSLYEIGDYKQAEKLFADLIKQEPLNGSCWFGLAGSLQMQKEYREALPAWNMTSFLTKENPLPSFHAAECHFSLGEIEKGREKLKEAHAQVNGDLELEEKITALASQWKEEENG